jgi:hypothetical protein
MRVITPGQARHIQINAGNVLTIGILSLIWLGVMDWTSSFIARKDLPVVSPLAVGAQNYLHANG